MQEHVSDVDINWRRCILVSHQKLRKKTGRGENQKKNRDHPHERLDKIIHRIVET